MTEHRWRVVPLSPGQRLDVRLEDFLEGGLYRRCDTLRGGGGYDLFPSMCERFLGECPTEQFVVQLQGCNLDCHYCYVTREGVWGPAIRVTTPELVSAYRRSCLPVLHLMGGAPALQMRHWPELLQELRLTGHYIFHSDMMLTEGPYDEETLYEINRHRAVIAVNVKGTSSREWIRNTRRDVNWDLLWANLGMLNRHLWKFYITYTNCNADGIAKFEEECQQRGVKVDGIARYSIDLIDYNALVHVDDRPWGVQGRIQTGETE